MEKGKETREQRISEGLLFSFFFLFFFSGHKAIRSLIIFSPVNVKVLTSFWQSGERIEEDRKGREGSTK